jgi:hypothetical protein
MVALTEQKAVFGGLTTVNRINYGMVFAHFLEKL